MSHLKLQKLLYYCEGYHLAYFDDSLIPEEFEAWVHGPVCRKVYDNLKGSSLLYADLIFNGDYNPEKEINNKLNSEQLELLFDVLTELSTWTGLELENATHNEFPWCQARNNISPADRCENEISNFGNFKVSFQYVDSSQKFGSGFKDWQQVGLLSKMLEAFKGYCCRPLLEQVDGKKFTIYGDFPPKDKTHFEQPATVPEDANWARIHITGKAVVVGHIVTDTFYVVFLDRSHKFFLTGKDTQN